MAMRPRLLKARRHHGPGHGKHVDVTFFNERLHANGVFSNVYSATLSSPKLLPVAIKKCWPRNSLARKAAGQGSFENEREDANDGKAETELLSSLKHPHIVLLLYSFSVKVDADVCNCMILEFMPSDLSKVLKNRHQRKLDNLDIKLYSWQLFSALDYISCKGVAHRDVKPANLLVNETTGILKLADFGNAKVLRRNEKYPPYQVTRYYRAPELVFESQFYTTKVDVWAAACVVGELYVGRPILAGSSTHEQAKLLVEIFGYPTQEQLKMMRVESRPRLVRRQGRGLKTILPENVVDDLAFDLLSSILKFEPGLRLSYDLILGHEYFDILRSQPTPVRRCGLTIPKLDYWISEESTQED
uniref:Protein kinase domain-containing protein n=1 Tax=Panagrolaimus sp. JU765 TaxID=591449 RepID=A0AC34RT00_9BILA